MFPPERKGGVPRSDDGGDVGAAAMGAEGLGDEPHRGLVRRSRPRGYEVSDGMAAKVLAAVARSPEPELTLGQIADVLHLRPTTVSRVAAALRDDAGLLENAPRRIQAVGRPLQPVRLAQDRFLLGFSISDIVDLQKEHPGPHAHVSRLVGVLTTLDGTRVETMPVKELTAEELTDPTGQALIARIADGADWLAGWVGAEKIVGLGVALGGVVHRGVVRQSCNLAWQSPIRLEDPLRERFPNWHAVVENDANAMLLRDAWRRRDWSGGDASTPPETFMVVLISHDGIGGAVFASGARLAGHRGAAGELGHVKVPEAAGAECRCDLERGARARGSRSPDYGCLEAFSAPTKTLERALARLGADEPKDLATAAAMTDQHPGYSQVTSTFADAGGVLGREIAGAATWIDPAVVIVYLPSEIALAEKATPAAAYRDAIASAMPQVYPDAPPLVFDDIEQLGPTVAQAAASAAFDRMVNGMRRDEPREADRRIADVEVRGDDGADEAR